jgi:hypothetical protein
MSDQITTGLAFKPYDHTVDGDRPFDDEYTITVARRDGKGLTQIEAETVLSMYLMAVKTGAKKKTRRPKENDHD